MKNQLDQELEKAFLSLDDKNVKSLLSDGADKSFNIRNELLLRCIRPKPAKGPLHLDIQPINQEHKYWINEQNRKYDLIHKQDIKEYKLYCDIMKMLLINGANPNYYDSDPDGYGTALNQSLVYCNFDQANLLVDNGADVNMYINSDPTLNLCAQRIDYCGFESIKFLHNHVANLNAQNKKNGKNALMNIAGYNRIFNTDLFTETKWIIEPIRFLSSHRANVNLCDKSGKTAIMHSLCQNWDTYYDLDKEDYPEIYDNFSMVFYYEIPKILLSNGALIDMADKKGKKAMDYAEEFDEKLELFTRAIYDSKQRARKNR